jgi:pimeloyl-ACP methyl ester carboxylesterase
MRALAVALLACVACGNKPPVAAPDEGGEDGPFVNDPNFKPTAFTVDVTGEGRPIIFIPGLGCPGDVWNDTVERLGEGFESHVITLAGFAGNKPIRPPLAAKTRKELVRYIRSRKLDRPIVVGHSMGGFIAFWLAATARELGGAVVVDAGPRLGDADLDDARRLRNAWAQAGDEEVVEQIEMIYSLMVKEPKTIEPFLADIAKSDPQSIGDAIYELVTTDVSDKLDSIKVPVLLVLADGGFADDYAEMVEDIPEHDVVVIKKAKHFVFLDDPEGFHAALAKFLRAHSDDTAE